MEERIKNGHKIRDYKRTGKYSQFGRSYCYITCPFCNEEVKAYIWSLAGCGKKCSCGAVHTYYGFTAKKIEDN